MTHAKEQIKERPILFSGPMARAILEGRKTQTRRAIKPQPDAWIRGSTGTFGVPKKITNKKPHRNGTIWQEDDGTCYEDIKCPYGQPGERLWVRETWAKTCIHPDGSCDGDGCDYCSLDYRADDPTAKYPGDWPNNTPPNQCPPKWKPSIYMPRCASRILLEITEVRVERLQEISEADALAEGVLENPNQDSLYDFWHYGGSGCWGEFNAVGSFNSLWESINGPESWEANPWVWAITFKKINP